MLSRIRQKNSINFQSAFCTRSAVSSLHFLMTGLVLLFLFERASSPDRNIGARKKILVRLSWPLWLMCGLYVEELTRKSTMIELWLLYTDWRRTQMRGLPIWRLLMLFRVVTSCVEMNTGLLGVNISASWFKLHFQKFGNVNWGYYFIKPYKHFISFNVSFWASTKLILTFTNWGGVACEFTSVYGPQCISVHGIQLPSTEYNFRPRNTTSVHGIQLPSTEYNFRQYLLHHDTSFIAFSMNELKRKKRPYSFIVRFDWKKAGKTFQCTPT